MEFTTSKKLLWIFVWFFIISIMFVGLIKMKYNIDLSFLLNYITPLSTSVILGYATKSSFENVAKIKNATNTSVAPEPSTLNNSNNKFER